MIKLWTPAVPTPKVAAAVMINICKFLGLQSQIFKFVSFGKNHIFSLLSAFEALRWFKIKSIQYSKTHNTSISKYI
jgi:hypothetical protein